MSRIEQVIVCVGFLAACVHAGATNRRLNSLENRVAPMPSYGESGLPSGIMRQIFWLENRVKALESDCGKKKVAAAPPSCPRSKFCPCTPPCQCSECRCGGALPAPETPLITARVHDGQAFIAWIDGDGRRQERTLTEEEFCKLNTKSE